MEIVKKLNIRYKLLLLMFSINHIHDKYRAAKAHEKLLVYLQIIEKERTCT